MGLDEVDVDCRLEVKGDADPANAAKPPDELVFYWSQRVRRVAA